MTTQARELAKLVNNAGDLSFSDDIHLLSDAGVLNFGADNDVTLTHVADTGLLLNSSRQLQFGDSGTFIRQEADGVLDLTSDTEIELNATTLDINANVDISGTLTVAGALDFGDLDISNVGSIALDTITNDGTDITLDSSGDIILDADGGDINLKDGGTLFGQISNSSGLYLVSSISDADIFIRGNDGGSMVNALTFDMENAGAATFNDKVIADSFETTAGGTFTTASGNDLNIVYPDTRSLFIKEAGTTHVTVDNTGKVGIGTTGPAGLVTIHKDVTGANDQEMLTIRRDGGATSDGARQASIAFFDGNNDTYTGKISGYRDSPAGNYDGGLRFYVNPHATNANATFAELDGTPAMYMNPDRSITTFGHVYMPNGSGISFASMTPDGANSASVGSEILDDYEEGTWTPQLSDLGGNLATLSTAEGSYTKIGRMVFLHYRVIMSSKGSMTGNYIHLKNIPFNHPTAAYNGTGTVDYFASLDSQVSSLAWDTSSTASVFWLTGVTSTSGYSTSYIPTSYLGGNEQFKGTIIYQTDV